ncbi:MAG: DUF6431 domain-containing protein [Planctomycetota bacterium]
MLGIVGHGTYERQLLPEAPGDRGTISVRRYLCLTCRRTISVLPDQLLPWRWYSGATILIVLVRLLIDGLSVASLREEFGPGGRFPYWKSPRRWAHQLCKRLWSWHAAALGDAKRVAPDELLRRLLALGRAHARSPNDELERAARDLVGGTSHSRFEVRRTAQIA